MLEVHQFPCLSDNYGYLLHDSVSKETACIDTPDADEYLKQANLKGWNITQIWNTHWHPDHAGGNAAIKAATGCAITAPQDDAAKIDAIDKTVNQGDHITIGSHQVQVINVGGHTKGHIAFYVPHADIAFVGDSLFALGCGRMFEGTPSQFWHSLERLKQLPENTLIYCAHEYTASNARFALHADPENTELQSYVDEITEKRRENLPTVPAIMGRELKTNPFLRADTPEIQARWSPDTASSDAIATFAALRAAKDTF